MIEKLKRNIVPIFILIIIYALIINPSIVSEGAFNGLNLWINKIVPFLFPMFILSNILLQYNFIYSLLERFSFISNKLLKSKFALIPYFISFISGYPSGALVVDVMAKNKKISSDEANYMILFTNNCSFQFISAVVAFSMLDSLDYLIFLILPHFLGAILLSFLYSKNTSTHNYVVNTKTKVPPFNEIFSSSIYKAIISILTVGGVIVIFSVFSQYIMNSLISNKNFMIFDDNTKNIIFSFLVGIFEMTNGCSIISASMLPIEIKLIILNFLISFSGMSIIFQTIAVTTDFKFEMFKYIKGKFIFGVLSSFICVIMLLCIKILF